MPTALLLSPHLDDVAFSCGGLAASLSDAGWRVVMATAFTATVPDPTGFALACQLDKGLGAEVDYMAVRRAEDLAAAAILGVETRWLDLPEAPHRSYDSAAALFGTLDPADDVHRPLAERLSLLLGELSPALVAAPQGRGGHVDHRQTIRAAISACGAARLLFYRDAPYVIRDPAAPADPAIPDAPEATLDIAAALARKIAASSAYATQIGFQFGGPAGVARALTALAAREAGKAGGAGERFVGILPWTGHRAATL